MKTVARFCKLRIELAIVTYVTIVKPQSGTFLSLVKGQDDIAATLHGMEIAFVATLEHVKLNKEGSLGLHGVDTKCRGGS